MKFVIVFALALCTASAFHMNNSKLGITNGKTAAAKQFTYLVGIYLDLGRDKSSWCGGSLIGAEWVLTATHCIIDVKYVTVYLGGNERGKGELKYFVSISNFIFHDNYDSKTHKNDISLIKIPKTTFTDNIKVVKLPAICASYSDFVGETAVTAGWGYTSDTVKVLSDELKWASNDVIANNVCARNYGSDITDTNLCVSTAGGVSPCTGDSGGPLVLESSNVQIGVISYGAATGCATEYPEVFSRVTSYLPWIKEKTGISY